jgi:hypothetical protein
MTRSAGYNLALLVLVAMIVQLFVISYVFYQSYQGRLEVVYAQRIGCERNKLDRNDNAAGWRIAEAARRAEGQIGVANQYAHIASGLEARSRIDCVKAYPNPGVLP